MSEGPNSDSLTEWVLQGTSDIYGALLLAEWEPPPPAQHEPRGWWGEAAKGSHQEPLLAPPPYSPPAEQEVGPYIKCGCTKLGLQPKSCVYLVHPPPGKGTRDLGSMVLMVPGVRPRCPNLETGALPHPPCSLSLLHVAY